MDSFKAGAEERTRGRADGGARDALGARPRRRRVRGERLLVLLCRREGGRGAGGGPHGLDARDFGERVVGGECEFRDLG